MKSTVKVAPLFLILISLVQADLLYETDFDDFPVGPNQWAGNDGWLSNDASSGAQTIDDDLVPALVNTASLGFNRPSNAFTSVALNLGYDHVATGVPEVEIDALIGIEDSMNDRRDDFFLSIYNSLGQPLASIRFDNQDPEANNSQFGIWREDGVSQFDTLLDFIPGELFNLFITLNLENNTWSADVGGNPLFENAELTATNNAVNFGLIAFEWDLSIGNNGNTFLHGDNFLLLADLSIRSKTVDPNPPFVVTHSYSYPDNVTLTWPTGVGFEDQVEYSSDLETWSDDLPNSRFENISNSSVVSFTDDSPEKGVVRFYRVKRTSVPE